MCITFWQYFMVIISILRSFDLKIEKEKNQNGRLLQVISASLV